MTESNDNDNDPHDVVYNGVDAVSEFVSTVKVHPSVTEIPAAAFQHCRYFLWKVELPEGLVKIGSGAFSELRNLEMINLPSTVTEIGEHSFSRCFMLKEIVLPQGLLKIGKGAFERTALETIHFPPLIETIESECFSGCKDLYKVVLPVNLQEIKESAFYLCKKLTSIDLPPSLRILGNSAFDETNLEELHLPNSLEVCGSFGNCMFPNFRIPPMITNVDMSIFDGKDSDSDSYVSIELPEDIKQIVQFPYFYRVRNMAIPKDCILDIGNVRMFNFCRFLQARFDDLPLHKICYYHSYHDIGKVLSDMGRVGSTKTRLGKKLCESGKRQDSLGMTPLHILACSTKHHLEMYQLLVERYPETLVTKDRWDCVPLVYALWCNAPSEVLVFLVESYKATHPEFVFDWEAMTIMLAQDNAPLRRIQTLLDTYERCFSDQKFDMTNVVKALESTPHGTIATFQLILRTSLEKRLKDLDVWRWTVALTEEIDSFSRFEFLEDVETRSVYSQLARYESYKEAAYLLELALWKSSLANRRKKARSGNPSKRRRNQCRIGSGAEIVIPNVLPFLWEDEDRPWRLRYPYLYGRTRWHEYSSMTKK